MRHRRQRMRRGGCSECGAAGGGSSHAPPLMNRWSRCGHVAFTYSINICAQPSEGRDRWFWYNQRFGTGTARVTASSEE